MLLEEDGEDKVPEELNMSALKQFFAETAGRTSTSRIVHIRRNEERDHDLGSE